MGILQYLGLDELADSVNELTQQFDGLRDDIVSSITDAKDSSQQVISDISNSLSGEDTKE